MTHPHEQEERDAWFSRADRFDGFDRGDLDSPHADDHGDEPPTPAEVAQMMLDEVGSSDEAFSFGADEVRTVAQAVLQPVEVWTARIVDERSEDRLHSTHRTREGAIAAVRRVLDDAESDERLEFEHSLRKGENEPSAYTDNYAVTVTKTTLRD